MATYMGRQMAEYINGVEEANLWRDIPFKRIPGHFGPPWFLPFAGAYYKFQDLIKWAWACRSAATSSRGDADAHALDG